MDIRERSRDDCAVCGGRDLGWTDGPYGPSKAVCGACTEPPLTPEQLDADPFPEVLVLVGEITRPMHVVVAEHTRYREALEHIAELTTSSNPDAFDLLADVQETARTALEGDR